MKIWKKWWFWVLIVFFLLISFVLFSPILSEKYTRVQIEKANYCDVKEECVLLEGECLFGCGVFVNENEADKIKDLIDDYDSNSQLHCGYMCMPLFDVNCDKNKCVAVYTCEGDYCEDMRNIPKDLINRCGDNICQEWELNESHPFYCPKDCEGVDKYLEDERYCEESSDCILRDNCCNPCHKDYVNKYNSENSGECAVVCTMECPSPSTYTSPTCVSNQCVPS